MLSIREAEELVQEAFQLGMLQSDIEARDFALFAANQAYAKDILELGTRFGGSLYLLDRACDPGLRISVDMPWGERDVNSPPHEALFHARLSHVRQFFGNIHDEAVCSQVAEFLGSRKVDLLFADADHGYEGSKRHFQMYGPFIRSGGYFAIHDVGNRHPCQDWWEREIEPNYRTWKFLEPANQYGIGVAQIP